MSLIELPATSGAYKYTTTNPDILKVYNDRVGTTYSGMVVYVIGVTTYGDSYVIVYPDLDYWCYISGIDKSSFEELVVTGARLPIKNINNKQIPNVCTDDILCLQK